MGVWDYLHSTDLLLIIGVCVCYCGVRRRGSQQLYQLDITTAGGGGGSRPIYNAYLV